MFLEEKMTFIEKRGCGFGVLTVEPPSPAAQRCTNGAPDGADGAVTEVAELDADEAVRIRRFGWRGAPEIGRILLVLSPRFLKLIISEEICGRFGSFDGSTSVYRASRGNPMI